MQNGREILREVVSERAVNDPRHEQIVADELVAGLAIEVLRTLAAVTVAGELWSHRRRHARNVESASASKVQQAVPAPRPAVPAPRRQADDFARLLDDPTLMYYPDDERPKAPVILPRRAEREAFRRWAGDRFDSWHTQAREAAESVGDDDMFHEHWHPEGPAAASRDRWVVALRRQVNAAARRERLVLTRELLGSAFALGDGTRTTWGAASVAEHEQRVELLIRNAGANAEAAVRHRAAVNMLREAGAETLVELSSVGDRGAA